MKTITTAPIPQYSPQSYGISMAYYSTRGNLNARLTLNNKGTNQMTPRLTLYARDGRRHTFTDIVIEPRTFLEVDLRDRVLVAGDGFEDGSLRVSYVGGNSELGGLLRMTNSETGIEFDDQLIYPSGTRSNRLEAAYFVPRLASRSRLVVTNITGEPVQAVVSFGPRPTARNETLQLGPWQLQVIDLDDVSSERLAPGANHPGAQVGSISVTYTGTPGSVMARGWVVDSSVGYSGLITFVDPAQVKTSRLHASGVRIAPVGANQVEPWIVARNTATGPIKLSGRLWVTDSQRRVSAVELPATTIGPSGTRMIDVGSAWARGIRQSGTDTIGLELEYDSAPGTVVVSAATVTDDLRHVFRAPLYDASAQPSAAGDYFWHLQNSQSTIVSLTNTTNDKQYYKVIIRHSEGFWMPKLQSLKPHESVAMDIRAIRDDQVRDAKGRTIPASVERGQIHWSLMGGKRRTLIGRAELVDLTKEVSSTFACPPAAEDIYYSSEINPGFQTVPSGQDAGFTVEETDRNAITMDLDPPVDISESLSWTSSNNSIAYPDPYPYNAGWFWGDEEGTIQVNAYGESRGFLYWNGEGQESEGHEIIDEYADLQVACAVPRDFQMMPAPATYIVSSNHLRFQYKWASTSGNVQDLYKSGNVCQVGEEVIYDNPWTSPPWGPGHTSPYVANVNGNLNAFPGNAWAGFVDNIQTSEPVPPYEDATVTGSQTYRYRCSCKDNNAWNTLGTSTIVRQIGMYWDAAISEYRWQVSTSKEHLTGNWRPLAGSVPSPGVAHSPRVFFPSSR